MPANDMTRWLRAGGIAIVVLALAVSAIEVSREGRGATPAVPAAAALDPLAVELARCNAVTPAGPRDEACERAWAENRRRFLGQTRPAPTAEAMQPTTRVDRP